MDTRRDPLVTSTLPATDGAIEGTSVKVGDVLDGKYHVDHVLGVGGMGIVLAATHQMLRQKVAIKLLLPSSLGNAIVVARFEREARAAATLRSDHVARVIDVGKLPNGSPYMVMEFLEGSDLEAVAERVGPLAADVAVNHVLQACEAIAEAHNLGIIHRDLKPQNLFLTKRLDGSPLVKVLDFGISKMPNEAHQPSLTRSHDVMGSPLYMSPEQLRGVRDVDARSDIWALGAILYRLVAGQTPFDGETMAQLCSRVLMDEPPSIRTLRPDLPDGLEVVIERCLRKAPAERFADVADLARALDPFASHRSVRAAQRVIVASNRPPALVQPSAGPADRVTPAAKGATTNAPLSTTAGGKKRKGASLFLVVGLLAFIGAGAGAALWRSRRAPADPAPAATQAAAVTASASAPATAVALEPTSAPAAPVIPSAAAVGSSTPRAPGARPGRKSPPRKPATASSEKPDDAPDLRK